MYIDQTPERDSLNVDNELWTVALVSNDDSRKEVHFGAFVGVRAGIDAKDSGKVTTREDEHLELRRIRRFPA